MSVPPPATARIGWECVPRAVRDRVALAGGGEVVHAALAPGGFSAGFAGVVTFADGARTFVKAGDGTTNSETAALHRREGLLTPVVPDGFAPRLRWRFEEQGWVVLGLEPIDGRHPGGPWTADDLDAVLRAHARLAAHPAPPDLRDLADPVADTLRGWSLLSDDDAARAHPRLVGRREELAAWEGRAARDAAAGDAIVHLDLRSDNILIGGDGAVTFVDWPHAGRGAPWLDLPFFAPTVTLEGGPTPSAVVAASPMARSVDPAALRVLVAGWAGRLLWAGRQPPPPGIPHLRAFQSAQAAVAVEWLVALLDP